MSIPPVKTAATPDKPKADTAAKRAALLKLQAETAKLNVERELLEKQLAPGFQQLEWLKGISGATGIILALATLFGGLISVFEWVNQQEQSRQQRSQTEWTATEKRLDGVLLNLASDKVPIRLAALSSLRSFMDAAPVEGVQRRDSSAWLGPLVPLAVYLSRPDGDDKGIDPRQQTMQEQVLVSVANQMAVETDANMLSGMADFLSDIKPETTSDRALTKCSASLAGLNRRITKGLMNRWEQGKDAGSDFFTFVAVASLEDHMVAVDRAMVALMKEGSGYKDYTGVMLVRQQLQGLPLEKADFSYAILDETDFGGAHLEGANFTNSHLLRVTFKKAHLADAHFVMLFRGDPAFDYMPEHNFVETEIDGMNQARHVGNVGEDEISEITLPDFQGADLSRATFDGFPVFNLKYPPVADALHRFPRHLTFDGATLTGTNFTNAEGLFSTSDEQGSEDFLKRMGIDQYSCKFLDSVQQGRAPAGPSDSEVCRVSFDGVGQKLAATDAEAMRTFLFNPYANLGCAHWRDAIWQPGMAAAFADIERTSPPVCPAGAKTGK